MALFRSFVLATTGTILLASTAAGTASSFLDLIVLDETEVELPRTIVEAQQQEEEDDNTPPRFPKGEPKDKPPLNPVQGKGVEVRIVNGDMVNSESAYPFFVSIPDIGCGASLIHDDILLGAAHCDSWQTSFGVYVNSIYRYDGIYRTVNRRVIHPLYDPQNYEQFDYDYMVMKLDTSALVDDYGSRTNAEPVTLNLNEAIPATDDTLTAIGMGYLSDSDWYPSYELREVNVKAVNNDVCYAMFGYDTFVPDIMICTDGDGGGTCFGDSGGPLLTEDNVQVGIVSYGPGGCPKDKIDAVYSRVSGAQEWIEEQVCQWSDTPPENCDNSTQEIPTGPGAMTLSIKTDRYGYETAFNLKHTQTGEYYWDVPFGNMTSSTLFSAPSENLPVGNYTLEVRDSGYSGICCYYGRGFFYITDDTIDEVIYVNEGTFYDYTVVQLYIDDTGETHFVANYDWEQSDNQNPANVPNYPQEVDEAWPGPEPYNFSSLFVNVKFDTYPQETTWELSYQDENEDWILMESYDGAEDFVPSDVVSTQFYDLEPGWYKFSIEDSDGDGICCAYRRGWVALTGFLEATKEMGLVYGNNGEFEFGTEVYFEMNEDGYFYGLALDEEAKQKMMTRRRRMKERRREL